MANVTLISELHSNMTQENLLQRTKIQSLLNWQRREEIAWCASIRRFLLVVMLVSCSYRLIDEGLFSPQKCTCVLVAAGVTLAFSVFVMIWQSFCLTPPKWLMVATLTITQLYILSLAVFVYPDSKELWAVKSTIVFCVYEIPSIHSSRVVILLLARHFLMWQLPSVIAGRGVHSVWVYATMLFFATVILLIAANEVRSRTSEHYRFCESIDEQEAKIDNLLQAIPEGLAVVTEAMEIVSANAKMLEILDAERGLEKRLQRVCCLLDSDTEETKSQPLLDQIHLFLRSPSSAIETFGVSKVSSSYYEWKGTKCSWGKSLACILTVSDISLWLKAKRNLQQESDSKTAMLRFVSHELRTPANAIYNLTAKVMAGDNLSLEQKTELSIVTTSTTFLLSVVNDLLDFTRIVADKFRLVKQSFSIKKEIADVVKLFELQCAHKGLCLTLKLDPLIPDAVYSDPTRIKQVALNLLGNALKFTYHGGVSIICVLADTNTVRVSVKDTGIGIPEDKIAGLCQVFGTVEGTQRINPQGCGLGLYISNLLAISLGGKPIDIHSKPGVGSEFSFLVRIYQMEVEEESGVVDTTTDVTDERDTVEEVRTPGYFGGHQLSEHSPPSVLIVDDCDFNRIVLVKMLETMHVQADEAASGLQALSLICDNALRSHYYSLILMDVEMPEMDGITATREIRSREKMGELPGRVKIVACSAHRGREETERLLAAGMDGYLEKPVIKSTLEQLILTANCNANTYSYS